MTRLPPAASTGFARAAAAYERGRPGYPSAAVDLLAARLRLGPGRRVVDLAAGTGKLARPLLTTGAEVIAVEPVAEMRAALPAGARAVDGTAEAMPLPGASADAVAVAQAFHWFDGDAALAEINRVLRPGGALALVWNRRRMDDPQNLDRIEELLDLALDLGAQRLELANTQYYGWAVANQDALMPSWEQLRRAEEAVQRFRERVGPKVDVFWVLPDFYEELPKPCMGGWGRMYRTMKRPLRV